MGIVCIQVVVYTHSMYHCEGGFHSYESTSGIVFLNRLEFAASKGSITVSNAKDNGRSIKINGVSMSGVFNESPA